MADERKEPVRRKLTTEQIIEDAEITATFFRNLVGVHGIPVSAATTLAGQYVQTVVIARYSGEKPKDPWEG